MKRYETQIINLLRYNDRFIVDNVETLNKYGEDGWHVVALLTSDNGRVWATLQRIKTDDSVT